eukprot:8313212-Alexandrium_andersonii.AAC.1
MTRGGPTEVLPVINSKFGPPCSQGGFRARVPHLHRYIHVRFLQQAPGAARSLDARVMQECEHVGRVQSCQSPVML